ncbi:MAG: DUF721 domain-containing protein [Pseudomonadota bacterium]|jgi:hypothetical protein
MQARCLDAYLHSADSLARLRAHAQRLVELQRVYADIAPAYLAESSRVANHKQGKLVIHADNGAVAAKLRQIVPSLCDEFGKRGFEVTEIQVKAQPLEVKHQAGRWRTAISVSAHAKNRLSALASSLPADSPLKAALENLVRRSR